MNKKSLVFFSFIFFISFNVHAQDDQAIIDAIVKEVYENSQLESLGHELMDDIGPRLVGTPQMQQAHDWVIAKYSEWGIPAENQQWGEWKAWERGITHIDMIHPRIQTLHGTQLAWSPGTSKDGIIAELVVLPWVENATQFEQWLPNVKGKFVMIERKEETGRPDYNWEKFATPESFQNMKDRREAEIKAWNENMENIGHTKRSIVEVLENAGAAGIIDSYWSKGFGAHKIFGARTKNIPSIDIDLTDYTMLYRMVEHGDQPKLQVVATSKDLGIAPTFNTIAEIRGSEKPEEYIILSAHLDSWDGGTGATDNATGTLIMMETMRILKKLYPNPKRTIIAGHWGSEEQGLNGSSAFVEDNPEMMDKIQVLFNQDNGTGRVVRMHGSGFLHAYDYLSRWLSVVPHDIRKHIETSFPGRPSSGGTDNAPFVIAGVPAFNLGSLSWDYWNYTWHTNQDTYDKIVFDEVQNNVALTAILAYMASEDEEKVSREKIKLPIDPNTGEEQAWPSPRNVERKGGL